MPGSRQLCVLFLAPVLLAAGCETLPWTRVGLSERQHRELAAGAKTLAELGLRPAGSRGDAPRMTGLYLHDRMVRERVPLVDTSNTGSALPVIELSINGHRGLAAIDTGASHSLVGMRTVRAAGITAVGPTLTSLETITFDGTRSPVLAMAREVNIGSLRIHDVPFAVLSRLPGPIVVMNGPITEVDILLGQDLLRQFGSVTFGAGKGTLELAGRRAIPPETERPVLGRAELMGAEGGNLSFRARINGREPVDVVFDSGGGFGLWVPQAVASRIGLAGARPPVELRVANRLFRPSISRPVPPTILRVGRFSVAHLKTFVGEIEGGEYTPGFALLGNHVLKRHAVRMNYREGWIEFLAP